MLRMGPPCRKSGTGAGLRMEVQDRGPATAGYRTCMVLIGDTTGLLSNNTVTTRTDSMARPSTQTTGQPRPPLPIRSTVGQDRFAFYYRTR